MALPEWVIAALFAEETQREALHVARVAHAPQAGGGAGGGALACCVNALYAAAGGGAPQAVSADPEGVLSASVAHPHRLEALLVSDVTDADESRAADVGRGVARLLQASRAGARASRGANERGLAGPEGVLAALVAHEAGREAALVAEVSDADEACGADVAGVVAAGLDAGGAGAAADARACQAVRADPERVFAALLVGRALAEALLVARVAHARQARVAAGGVGVAPAPLGDLVGGGVEDGGRGGEGQGGEEDEELHWAGVGGWMGVGGGIGAEGCGRMADECWEGERRGFV
ncbi:unnamed protein product [Chondrus crispus]|uniref:Uncharacterized protein n=1 Tax=Chondrus crispus TaxID=2769 RepID=R7QEL6_CHOCR|nr:unnamed protein product [Chondrus crispus]CDF35901.1 unnamed protein product [Chondrus crispus]|eukprot:XP_005715720.1 unnamed protein product [Chondrus crispus]